MKSNKIKNITILGVLTALIFVLGFTPIGYLHVGQIAITFLVVPVCIGAILCGPIGGLYLGCVFGLTSLIQCFTTDPFGQALLSINPFFTAIVCIVPRALVGLFTGLIFKGLSKALNNSIFSYIITGLCASLLNTVLFLTFLFVFFSHTEYLQSYLQSSNLIIAAILFAGINAVVELFVNGLISTVLSKWLCILVKNK